MTAPAFYPKRFLLGANADLVNVDHVVRLFVGPDGKLFADMVSGPHVELVRGQSGFVGLIYVTLASPELACARVARRVQAGGHDVPAEKVRTRWQRS